ncbi:GerAB/ArcD/ProY family transporter [Gorillibacterium sp. sgz5001074]|uniref:GerAB/ArcD/ProY family transporter n=1 Tax=Gorillibacterium sp. sgz5001074 TaxID=3446695 RepID=UPI003F6677A9
MAKPGIASMVCLTYTLQSGVFIFILPRLLAQTLGTNAWLLVPVCGLAAAGNIGLIALVHRLARGRPVPELLERLLPRRLLTVLYGILALFWATLAELVCREHTLTVQLISFPATYPIVLLVFVEIVVLYLVIKGFETIWRSAVFFFVFNFSVVFLVTPILPQVEWARFTSFWGKEGHYSLMGLLDIYSGFLGYEMFLFLYPHVKMGRLFTAVQLGNGLVTFVYTCVAWVCMGFYSLEQLKIIKYPVLNLMAYVEFPFLVRIDDFIFNLLFLKILISTSTFTWVGASLLKRTVGTGKHRVEALLITVSTAGVLLLVPPTIQDTARVLSWFAAAETAVAFLLPLAALLCVGLVRRKERRDSYA